VQCSVFDLIRNIDIVGSLRVLYLITDLRLRGHFPIAAVSWKLKIIREGKIWDGA
jgi:hypothetical protein